MSPSPGAGLFVLRLPPSASPLVPERAGVTKPKATILSFRSGSCANEQQMGGRQIGAHPNGRAPYLRLAIMRLTWSTAAWNAASISKSVVSSK
jgi:hypothetical protein